MNKSPETKTSHKFSIIDDLVTPYFIKSVKHTRSKFDEDLEARIDNFLQKKGVNYFDAKNDKVTYSRKVKSCISQISIENKIETDSSRDISERKTALSLGDNSLFMRRMASSKK